jgi:hypothetical protein
MKNKIKVKVIRKYYKIDITLIDYIDEKGQFKTIPAYIFKKHYLAL